MYFVYWATCNIALWVGEIYVSFALSSHCFLFIFLVFFQIYLFNIGTYNPLISTAVQDFVTLP